MHFYYFIKRKEKKIDMAHTVKAKKKHVNIAKNKIVKRKKNNNNKIFQLFFSSLRQAKIKARR